MLLMMCEELSCPLQAAMNSKIGITILLIGVQVAANDQAFVLLGN
jgi:hypothetical protein